LKAKPKNELRHIALTGTTYSNKRKRGGKEKTGERSQKQKESLTSGKEEWPRKIGGEERGSKKREGFSNESLVFKEKKKPEV